MELISVGLNVLLRYWNKDFIDTFQSFDQLAFLHSLLYFIFIVIAIIIVSVYKNYLVQLLQLRWRRWLPNNFLSKYLSKHAYYHMSLLKNDNPDQRISMDINLYVENVHTLAIGLLNAFASLLSYVIALWSLSGIIRIKITQHFSFDIKGSMVWAVLIYNGLAKQNSEIQFLYLSNARFMQIQELIVRLPLKIGQDNG
ncbi:unnamed protein product [Rotaria sp. Silwood2]|nr:unnamed protein product [Rotaria sp. Silwood2]